MQGYIITKGGEVYETLCEECYDTGMLAGVRENPTVFIGSYVHFEIPCSICGNSIDGVEEDPKPTSFTVTVEVVVYADVVDVETGVEAGEYVTSILDSYVSYCEYTDVKEHFPLA